MEKTKTPTARKMDRKLVAPSQDYEIGYISSRYEIPRKEVRAAIKAVGISRRKVYKYLRGLGYTIDTKNGKP